MNLDRSTYEKQIDETMKVLNAAKAEFAKRGYETQTVRIVTQPFAELVKGLPDKEALAFLRSFDDLSQKKGFAPNVGPAMLHDTDDPAAMRLLAQALSTLPHLNASAIIADDDGIHWKTIRESAKLVRYVTDHSPAQPGQFPVHGDRDAQAARALLSGRVSHRRRKAVLVGIRKRQRRAASIRRDAR